MLKRLGMICLMLIMLGACQTASKDFNELSSIQQAVRFAPQNFQSIYFTDWTLLKQYEGVPELTGASDLKAKTRFWDTARTSQAVMAAFAPNAFRHIETWGWDEADVLWETQIYNNRSYISVVRLRDDLDLKALSQLFEQRGFMRSEIDTIPVYSYKSGNKPADWERYTKPEMFNTALLNDQHILIMAKNQADVEETIQQFKNPQTSAAESDAVQAVIKHFGVTASAIISTSDQACDQPSGLKLPELGTNLSPTETAEFQRQIENLPNLHEYQLLGVSYRYEQEKPVGLFVLEYDNPLQPTLDVQARQNAAEHGFTIKTDKLYRDTAFSVDSASVEDQAIVLKVRPLNDRPNLIFELVLRRDASFLAC